MKNSIVEIAFSGGNARLSRANSSSDLSGTFNWNTKKLGSASVASNIDILDIGTTDKTYTSAYAKVFGQRIDGTKIESKNILYSHKNSSGAVDTLILKNVTNDSYSYGLITSAQSNGNSSKYDILSEGNRYSISIRGKFSVSYGDAVKISGNIMSPDTMNSLSSVSGRATSVLSDKITVNNKVYKLSDKVTVYKRNSSTSSEYTMLSTDDLIKNPSKYTYTLYYDDTTSGAERVRVILVTEV